MLVTSIGINLVFSRVLIWQGKKNNSLSLEVQGLNFFQEKQEIILHLPLEPVSEKEKEKNMITTDMKEQEISNKFNLALADLNYQISGVNNHKGSLFTSDKESMKTLLKQIKEKSLFFRGVPDCRSGLL